MGQHHVETFKQVFQGQSNAIPEGIDLVSDWAGAPVQ